MAFDLQCLATCKVAAGECERRASVLVHDARMAIYIGHTTARRILESRLALQLEPVPWHLMHDAEAGKKATIGIIRAAHGGERPSGPLNRLFFCRADEPLDLLVPSHAQKRSWAGMSCHLCMGKLPSGSFRLLESGVYVASPALTLVQLAPKLTRIQIIKLAMSFCGLYHLEGDKARKLYERKPVTTPQEILEYLDLARATSMLGVGAVADAMTWVIPNSASPLETRMVLPLYLSRRLGGYGLPRPIMNHPIRLEGESAKIAGQSICFADSYWERPGRRPLDLECQSRAWHDQPAKYGEDYARQMALERKGIKVQFVTNMQLNDEYQFNELARLVSVHTGYWLPPRAYEWDETRRRMNAEVQGSF